MSRPQIHQFHIRAAELGEGSAHKSLTLAQRSVGEIKQRQATSLSRDGAADKDLSMAHFHETEGWKEGGMKGERERKRDEGSKGEKRVYVERAAEFSRVAEKNQ